jgi:hypothetical protein
MYIHTIDNFYNSQIGEYDKLENNKLKVLGFAGSLRAGSYNKALLRSATDLLPEDMSLEILILIAFLHSIKILKAISPRR